MPSQTPPDASARRALNGVCHLVGASVYLIALSPDGTRAATGSYNGQVGIWDAATGKLIKQRVPVPVE